MKVIRSWPEVIPPGRAYVHDDLDRLVISDLDYRPLADIDEDVILLEWDIAVGRDDLLRFAERIRHDSTVVRVAPYRLYPPDLSGTNWAHRGADMEPVLTGERFCALFGLGMAYLPRAVVRDYFDANPEGQVTDSEFSSWHFQNVNPRVPIEWAIKPVHLHFNIGGFSRGI